MNKFEELKGYVEENNINSVKALLSDLEKSEKEKAELKDVFNGDELLKIAAENGQEEIIKIFTKFGVKVTDEVIELVKKQKKAYKIENGSMKVVKINSDDKKYEFYYPSLVRYLEFKKKSQEQKIKNEKNLSKVSKAVNEFIAKIKVENANKKPEVKKEKTEKVKKGKEVEKTAGESIKVVAKNAKEKKPAENKETNKDVIVEKLRDEEAIVKYTEEKKNKLSTYLKIKKILKKNPDLANQEKEGKTVLQLAVGNGRYFLSRLFVKKGANVTANAIEASKQTRKIVKNFRKSKIYDSKFGKFLREKTPQKFKTYIDKKYPHLEKFLEEKEKNL